MTLDDVVTLAWPVDVGGRAGNVARGVGHAGLARRFFPNVYGTL